MFKMQKDKQIFQINVLCTQRGVPVAIVSGGYANVRSKCLRMRIRQNSDAHFYLGKSKNNAFSGS